MIVTKKFNPSDLDEKSEDGNDQKMNWKEKIELLYAAWQILFSR